MNEYIKNLTKNFPERKKPLELDLVIEGGAYNGYYGLGSLLLLKELEKQNYISVNRISGSSVGALFGTAFFFNKLNEIIIHYQNVRDYYKEHLNMGCLEQLIEKMSNDIDENMFKKIKNDKLFLTYYNKTSLKQKIMSKYKNKKELCQMLQASSHIPFMTSNTYFHRHNDNEYIDGGTPFIFKERKRGKNKKILYISIINLSKIGKSFSIKNEHTPHGRMLEGIVDTYKLFANETPSNMCSFVDDWSGLDFVKIRLKELAGVLFIYSLLMGNQAGEFVYPYVKDTKLYNLLIPFMLNLYRDFMMLTCF